MTTGREGKRYPMHLASYKTAPTREGGGRLRMPCGRVGDAGREPDAAPTETGQSSVSVSCTPPTRAEQML